MSVRIENLADDKARSFALSRFSYAENVRPKGIHRRITRIYGNKIMAGIIRKAMDTGIE